jgi:hypothetical protein
MKVMEKLYRAAQWKITSANHPYDQVDSRTILFNVTAAPDKEATVKYTVDYRW